MTVSLGVGPGPGYEKSVHKIADRFATCDTGDRSEDDRHGQFDTAENIGLDDRSGDVIGVGPDNEEYTREAYDSDTVI